MESFVLLWRHIHILSTKSTIYWDNPRTCISLVQTHCT